MLNTLRQAQDRQGKAEEASCFAEEPVSVIAHSTKLSGQAKEAL